ncbi:kelch repeat protein [Ostertagia ostertagi]
MAPRGLHSMAYHEKECAMYAFGGEAPDWRMQGDSCGPASFNDLWRLDMDELLIYGGCRPLPRHGSAIHLNELHLFNTKKRAYRILATTNDGPNLAGHASCMHGDLFIVHGGVVSTCEVSYRVSVLDMRTKRWFHAPLPGFPTPENTSILFIFDPKDPEGVMWQYKLIPGIGRWWPTVGLSPPPSNKNFGGIAVMRLDRVIRLISLGMPQKGSKLSEVIHHDGISCELGHCYLSIMEAANCKGARFASKPRTMDLVTISVAVDPQAESQRTTPFDEVDVAELKLRLRTMIAQLHMKYYSTRPDVLLSPNLPSRNSSFRRMVAFTAEIPVGEDFDPVRDLQRIEWIPQAVQYGGPPETRKYCVVAAHGEVVVHGGSVHFGDVKVNRESQQMILEETMEDCSIDDVREELPQQQPRFLLISYALSHSDGRTSYPMCLVFYSPDGCSPELQMMYAGSRNNLVKECELTKNFEIRDAEELTKEYLDSKLS